MKHSHHSSAVRCWMTFSEPLARTPCVSAILLRVPPISRAMSATILSSLVESSAGFDFLSPTGTIGPISARIPIPRKSITPPSYYYPRAPPPIVPWYLATCGKSPLLPFSAVQCVHPTGQQRVDDTWRWAMICLPGRWYLNPDRITSQGILRHRLHPGTRSLSLLLGVPIGISESPQPKIAWI